MKCAAVYRRRVRNVLSLLGILLSGGIIWGILRIPAGSDVAKETKYQCKFALVGIGLGIDGYCSKHGSFPPSYVADREGRPLHSWRVLLLPFLERSEEYALFSLQEPWDSPRNRVVARAVAFRSPFRCPAMTLADPTPSEETQYVGVSGPNTIFQGARPIRPEEVLDSLGATMLAVETFGTHIVWSEPRDFDVREMSFKVNDVTPQAIRSRHPGGAHILCADGSVKFLANGTDPAVIKAMTTIAGHEKVESSPHAGLLSAEP
ncbi:MAG: DUF1559 family PulG-like putative transporter [Thermogutta sp.]